MSEIIKVDNVSKEYRLGVYGGRTLREDLQSKIARILGKEDPNRKIGAKEHISGQKLFALRDVSFSVEKGERLGIIGRNGAGKSTILKLISGVTAPTSGIIYLDGRITSMLEVGTGFHKELTGRENVYLNGAILGMSKKEISRRFDEIVEFSEVGEFIDTPVKRYSSGMFVKLAFSVAAHLDSEIMIMDEVLAVGDVNFQNKCIDKMNEVSKNDNRTILYVSHNMNTIRQLCNRCVVLDKGGLIFSGEVDTAISIYTKTGNEELCRFFNYENYVREERNTLSVKFYKLEILNEIKGTIIDDELLQLMITYECLEKVEQVFLRISIQNKDENAICSIYTGEGVDFEQGFMTIKYSSDLRQLRKGHYIAKLILFRLDNNGTRELIDTIEKAFSFRVEKENRQLEAVWKSEYVGNVTLPDIQYEVLRNFK